MNKFEKTYGYPFCQPGDIFFARGTGRLAKMIRWAQRARGEPESWANHMGGITKPGYLVPPTNDICSLATATEALWHIKEHVWWDAHAKDQGYAIAVFRPRNFTGNEGVNRVVENWRTRTGEKYGWWRLGTFLAEKLTGLPVTRLHFQNRRIVCSNHIAIGLSKDAISFNDHDPNELDPDEGMDYAIASPEEFKFIGRCIVPAPTFR